MKKIVVLVLISCIIYQNVLPITAQVESAGRCSVCGMEHVNGWYVQLKNGQQVPTCSMTDGKEASTKGDDYMSHPARLGATMATYIMDDSECDNSCPECSTSSLADPVSGSNITADNFKYVCLDMERKIYFAGDDTKAQFIQSSKKTPYFAVKSAMCNEQECPDMGRVPKTNNVADGGSASVNNLASNEEFCSGRSVMFNGFQPTKGGTCVLLFFDTWILNTEVKYIIGFIGVFLAPLLNAFLIKLRKDYRKYASGRLATILRSSGSKTQVMQLSREYRILKMSHKLGLAFLFVAQMTVAYLLMLVAMTFETGLFIALVLGFGFSFVIMEDLEEDEISDVDVKSLSKSELHSNSSLVIRVEGMKCEHSCGSAITKSIENISGVKGVHMKYDEHLFYISGTVDTKNVLEIVDELGYKAYVVDQYMV